MVTGSTEIKTTVVNLQTNTPPSISNIGNQTISEDGNTGNIPFTVSDGQTSAGSLTVTATSSNTTLVPNSSSNLTLGGSGGSRTLKVTPAPNKYGTATITVTVSDGAVSTSDTFVVTVNSVNDAPTISNIGNRTIGEDGNTGNIAFTIGDVETSTTSLTVTATSNNTTLVPNSSGNLTLGGSGGSRTIKVTPVANKYGTATITVTVSDGSLSASDTFVVTVNSINDLPTISAIGNVTLNEGASTGAISFTVNDVETSASSLTVTASSSNMTYVPTANISLGGSGANRTVNVSARPYGGAGSSTITVTVSDGQISRIETFTVTVNDIPATLTLPATDSDGTYTISWLGGENVTRVWEKVPGGSWVNLSASSSGTVDGPYGEKIRTHTYNGTYEYSLEDCYYEGSQYGGVTLHCNPTDSGSVVVSGINNAPTISNIGNRTINENGNTGNITFTVSDPETSAGSLTVTATSSNTALVPNSGSNLTLGGSGGNRTIKVTPAANQHGTATITVTVSDGSLSTSDTFLVTVNGAPSISNIGNQTINEDGSTASISFSVSDPETSAGSLTVTATSSNTTLVPNNSSNLTLGGSAGSRTIKVTPAANKYGTATITVTVSDGAASASDMFVVTVSSVNDAPTIANIDNKTIYEDGNTGNINFTVGDVETSAGSLTVTATSGNTTLVPNSGSNLILGGSGSSRTINVTPAANKYGTATITVTVSDGSLSASDTFVVTVNSVNDTPTISAIGNVSLNEGESTGALSFTVGDVETAATSLTVTASSSNTILIPAGNVTLGGSGASRTINVSARPFGGAGTSTITVTVSDGQASRDETFTVTVNDIPAALTVPAADNDGTYTISWVGGKTVVRVWEKVPGGSWVNLSASPPDSIDAPFGEKTLTHLANGTYQYYLEDCYYEGSQQNGTTLHCNTTDTGSVVVTLPVPTATAGFSPAAISEGGSSTFSWSSTDANDCTATGIAGVSGTSGSVTYNASSTLGSNQAINATVTCTGYGGSDNATATLTVNWINDNPTISGIGDITINEDTNTGDIAFTVGDEETGAGALIVTATSDNTTLIPNGNITLGGSGANRTVRATPVTHLSGTATITVSVSDGVNAPVSEPFTVIVNSVNDIPTITSFNDLSMPMDTVTDELDFSISDVETPAASLTVTANSSDTQLIPNSNLILGGSDGNRTLMVIPASGQTGIATITVEVSDGQDSSSTSFDLSVVGEADPFDFAADAPPEFQYNLNDTSFLPDLGAGEFVALTQGAADVSSGVAQYTVPITLPPAINDLKPSLTLSYNSQGGNGFMGVGWSLSGLSTISRCPPTYATEGANKAKASNPRYTTADRLCMDGQKLEIASQGTPADNSTYWAVNAEYRTEIDSFSRIQAFGTHNGAHQYFEVRTKDGRILTYGRQLESQNSRIYAPGQGSGGPVSVWALDKVADRYGNQYTIHYARNNSDGDYYPTHVVFEPDTSVVFSYHENRDSHINGSRSDMPWGYDKGYLHKHPKLLDKVTTYINVSNPSSPGSGTKVREYDLTYTRSATTDRYLVSQIKECGFESSTPVCAKPLAFDWQEGELGFESTAVELETALGTDIVLNDQTVVDLNNDGYMDIVPAFPGASTPIYWGRADNDFDVTSSWTITGTNATWTSGRLIATPRGFGWIVIDDDPDRMGVVEVNKANAQLQYQFLAAIGENTVQVGDFNNDGLDDFINENTLWLQDGTDPADFTQVSTPFSGTPPNGAESTFADYNSDGLADFMGLDKAYANAGNNQFAYDFALPYSDSTSQPIYGAVNGYSFQVGNLPASQFRNVLDLNGDGLQDLAWHRKPVSGESNPGYWYAKLNTGNGFTEPVDDSLSSGTATNQFSFTHDWDKDGRQDLIVPNTSYNGWRVLLATFDVDGFAYEPISPNPLPSALNSVASATVGLPVFNLLRGDYNNDGLVDVAYVVSAGVTSVWYAKQQQPDLLKTVTDGFGAEVKFEYSPLSGAGNDGAPLYTPSGNVVFPQRHAPRDMQVVKKLSVSDGAGSYRHRYFNYTGAKLDVRGRGFIGFEKIVVTDTSLDTVTTTNFKQDFPFIGQVASTEIKDGNGILISITDNQYAIHGTNDRFPILDYSILRQYSLTTNSASLPWSVAKVDNTFDTYGNLTDQVTTIGAGLSGTTVTGIKRIVTVDNAVITNNTTEWLLGFIEERSETTTEAGGANARSVATEFDPEPGTLDVKVRRDFVGTPVWKTTNTTRNPNGIVEDVTVSAGDINGGTAVARSTAWSNFANVMYPQTQTNAKGHATTLAYDTRFGVVNSQTDANSLTLTREYDALGRLKSETASDGTVTAVKRFYCASAPVVCPANAVYLVITETTNSAATGKLGAPLSIVYYDQLQREVRRETYSLDGAVVKVDTEYYADGRVHRVSEPYTGLANHWTVYSNYDALDRPHNISGADGGSVHYDYLREGDLQKTVETVTVLTPDGNGTQVKTSYTNALGQVEQVLDDEQTPVDYAYDTQGNLESTMVNNNTATAIAISHDAAGNKTYISDPDAGVINFEYNGFGELRRQIWRKGTADEKSITYTYDVLGRKTGRIDTPVSGSPVSYAWAWDTAKKGRLDSRSGNGFTESYTYDSLARLQKKTTAISDLIGSKPFDYTYDEFGRLETVTYPDGFKVKHRYHAAGMQVQTLDVTGDPPNPKVLWALGEDSDERGSLYRQLLGNGVMTEYTLDAASGRLNRIQSGRLLGSSVASLTGSVQDLTYEFDTLGNLYERATGRTDLNGLPLEYTAEIFNYDDLNRLKTSDTLWDSLGTRSRSYNYDALGNLTYRSDIGTLSYDQSNGAGVHAVTGANGQSYEYDAYGNMKTHGADMLEYDVFNKPTKIGGTYFSYGPDHERFKQVDGDRATYYFGGGQYEEIIEAGVTTQRSHVGGYLVRNTRQGNTALTYLHTDHLGSVEAMTDELGNFIDRMSFDPWGLRQNPDWDDDPIGVDPINDPDHYPTTRGYTGHEMLDQVSLIHMNGRVYDPVIGRFLSADLFIQSPYNSQSFNRYSYVFNNPLSGTDPSGYLGPHCESCEHLEVIGVRDETDPWASQSYSGMEVYNFMMVSGYYNAPGFYSMGSPDVSNMSPVENNSVGNRVLQHIKENFSDINPRGDVISGPVEEGSNAETNPWTGDIIVPEDFFNDLSLGEFEDAYWTIFHEGMHSTDNMFRSWLDGDKDMTENHQKIWNRQTFEEHGYNVGPMWGNPGIQPRNPDIEGLYREIYK